MDKIWGKFECPFCRVVLHLGDPQHHCDPWWMLGIALERVERAVNYSRRSYRQISLNDLRCRNCREGTIKHEPLSNLCLKFRPPPPPAEKLPWE